MNLCHYYSVNIVHPIIVLNSNLCYVDILCFIYLQIHEIVTSAEDKQLARYVGTVVVSKGDFQTINIKK